MLSSLTRFFHRHHYQTTQIVSEWKEGIFADHRQVVKTCKCGKSESRLEWRDRNWFGEVIDRG